MRLFHDNIPIRHSGELVELEIPFTSVEFYENYYAKSKIIKLPDGVYRIIKGTINRASATIYLSR